MMSPPFLLAGLVCGIAAAGLAACDRPRQYECDPRVRQCVQTKSGDVQRTGGPAEEFEIRLSNTCQYEVDVKLCFDAPYGISDCREFTLRPFQMREERVELARFTGRSRLFMRRADEARACRFPLTRDVTFDDK